MSTIVVTLQRVLPASLSLGDPSPEIVLTLAPYVRGASAYEVAVAQGFVGDEAAWLLSLVPEADSALMDAHLAADDPHGDRAYADSLTTSPGGSNGQVQINIAGAFGGDPALTFDSSLLKIGEVAADGGGIAIPGDAGGAWLWTLQQHSAIDYVLMFEANNGAMKWLDANRAVVAHRNDIPFVFSTGVSSAPNTSISRVSDGVVGIGTGAAGSVNGDLSLRTLNASGAVVMPQAPDGGGTADTGLYFGSHATNRPAIIGFNSSLYFRTEGLVALMVQFGYGGGGPACMLQLDGTYGVLGFAHGSTPNGGPDAAIGSNAAGVLEVNNGRTTGTGGAFRDMKLRALTMTGPLTHAQYTNATEPSWVNGQSFFNTDLDKLRIGGASGWETVTSV
jgi:hypothetical protein